MSAAQVKDGGRSDRLAWSKRAELRLREELKEIALKRCDAELSAFAECARAKGLMVVFSCRGQNKAMNACLNQYTNEQSFQQYKQTREEELHARLANGEHVP
jgi:Cytochrome c oxidase biogenesis protein Cmc1 like